MAKKWFVGETPKIVAKTTGTDLTPGGADAVAITIKSASETVVDDQPMDEDGDGVWSYVWDTSGEEPVGDSVYTVVAWATKGSLSSVATMRLVLAAAP